MFSFHAIALKRLLPALLVVALIQLTGCGLNLGGPRAAAVKYVRGLIEQPDNSPELQKAYALLPNHVVIEYARALHKQIVVQKYSAEKLAPTADSRERIAVSILPVRDNFVVHERDHILVLTMENSSNQGWQVVAINTEP